MKRPVYTRTHVETPIEFRNCGKVLVRQNATLGPYCVVFVF